jgi:hypothetical protein
LLSFGPYPDISLSEARSKRDEAKRLLTEDTGPAVRKKLDRIAAETAARNTFGVIVDEFRENLEAKGAAASTMA